MNPFFIVLLHGITFQACLLLAFATKVNQHVHVSLGPSNTNPTPRAPSASSNNEIVISLPDSLDYEVAIPGNGGGPSPTVIPIIRPPGSSVVKGVECGSTYQMFAGQTVQIFSTNFNVANYQNYESCSWKFEANHCTLSAHCPCVEIPKSWECLGDYLRISTDYIRQYQRFCGGNRPGQPIYSESDFLNVKFRSDGRITAAGFTCFIRCEGPGMRIPLQTNITCPTSLVYKG